MNNNFIKFWSNNEIVIGYISTVKSTDLTVAQIKSRLGYLMAMTPTLIESFAVKGTLERIGAELEINYRNLFALFISEHIESIGTIRDTAVLDILSSGSNMTNFISLIEEDFVKWSSLLKNSY